MHMNARRAPLAAVCALGALLFTAPAALADPAVDPVFTQGNPHCVDYGLDTVTEFNPVASGTQSGVTLTKLPGEVFNWSSTSAIDMVIVKGGPNANVYDYPTDAFGDDGLHAPLNGDKPFGLSHVEFCTDGENDPDPDPNPGISLDKTGAATAAAGSTFTYSFKATNTGDVTLDPVELTDNRCQATLTRVEPNLADLSFDPGDVWSYACTVIAPAGPATVVNVAEVCGEYSPGEETPITVCDDDPHTFTVPPPPPVTPPVTPPTTPPTTPPGVTPPGDGGVLPEEIISGRAALRGPSGCVKQAFRARVSGRSIASVTFSIDGKKIKTIRGERSVYSIKVRPSKYGGGRHKLVARVQFTAASGTSARKFPLTFRRCAQGAVAPRFTG
jgi:hypothetical protein